MCTVDLYFFLNLLEISQEIRMGFSGQTFISRETQTLAGNEYTQTRYTVQQQHALVFVQHSAFTDIFVPLLPSPPLFFNCSLYIDCFIFYISHISDNDFVGVILCR